jgi:hypothetical protein
MLIEKYQKMLDECQWGWVCLASSAIMKMIIKDIKIDTSRIDELIDKILNKFNWHIDLYEWTFWWDCFKKDIQSLKSQQIP